MRTLLVFFVLFILNGILVPAIISYIYLNDYGFESFLLVILGMTVCIYSKINIPYFFYNKLYDFFSKISLIYFIFIIYYINNIYSDISSLQLFGILISYFQFGFSFSYFCLRYENLILKKLKGLFGKRKILFISANPINTTGIRINAEARDIEEGLKVTRKRNNYIIKVCLAARQRDLSRAILEENPIFLHFSGHGEIDGILLEDETGVATLVNNEGIASLFSLFKESIDCVVLNSCFSEKQADEISKHIPYVIGMKSEIPDKIALTFSTSFYDAIGAGRSIKFAFDYAVSNITMKRPIYGSIPTLIYKGVHYTKT